MTELDPTADLVEAQKDAFDNDPRRDSYDSTRVFSGHDRDGRVTNWCPPLYFPEWLERRRALTKDTTNAG